MKPLELAIQYMEVFYGDESIESLTELLTENCSFRGPFYTFDSAAAYIESLKSDPPNNFQYEIIEAYENDASACLVYQFSKHGISTPMTQTFEITNGKISSILLVFDTAVFR